MFLTWKDLWVTVIDRRNGTYRILQELIGYAGPGRMLAIMGPSGCGNSTLLDALGEAVCYSAQLQLPESMSKSEKKERAEATIREMGLQDARHTRIGGGSAKGLSGGQKRRVSICIEILSRPKLLFLDEPTSGLDSATSYHVMNRIAKLAQHDRRTVIASIHQPSSEVFELFHNPCLLSSGKTVYFGLRSGVEQFFASNGFPCPTLGNPSDYYLRTINKDFNLDIEQGGHGMNAEEAIETLVKSYESSLMRHQVWRQVSRISEKNVGGNLGRNGSQASFITQSIVLTKRSFVNMYRDLGYYWLRLAIYIALCLCVGTIFYDIGSTYGSIQVKITPPFMAIGGFPSFVEDMKVFGRERLNGHYSIVAFVIGNTFSSIPYLLIISLIPGAIAYYLVGLQKSFEHFAYFASVLFACMLLVESLTMIVASIVPDFLMGIITGARIHGVMMLNGGYFRLPDDFPKPFWRYPMYYISFHKYANQGFFKNEFEGLMFPNQMAGSPTIGEILRNYWQVEMGYSKWVDLTILLGMVVVYRLMFLGIIKAVEKMKPLVKNFRAKSPNHPIHVMENQSSTP
ncbi:hypothetical protein ACJRO7_034152 [Eucalyptus globulus]|uniref:ABC transporter domain-containing protein n=1 Tax=Eucalyptus globulus TaxID=34317 RepID=A0ABD3J5I8_EUCGL